MARQLRIEYAGAIYHIISRGNAQEAVLVKPLNKTNPLD
jgi:hypothetical protein